MLTRREPLLSIFELAVIPARHVPNNQVPMSSNAMFGTKHHVMCTELITICTTTGITTSRRCITVQLRERLSFISRSCLCRVIFTSAVLHILTKFCFALMSHYLRHDSRISSDTEPWNARPGFSVVHNNVTFQRHTAIRKLGFYGGWGAASTKPSARTRGTRSTAAAICYQLEPLPRQEVMHYALCSDAHLINHWRPKDTVAIYLRHACDHNYRG